MDIPFWKCVTTLLALLVFCLQITNVQSLAVMSIDIGSEWMKVSIVSVSNIYCNMSNLTNALQFICIYVYSLVFRWK